MLQQEDKTEILLVYLDCPSCGRFELWHQSQMDIAKSNGFTIREVSFDAGEVRQNKLMEKAKKSGIKNFPFFTDGKKFSKTLVSFVEKSTKTTKKVSSKRKNTRKKVANGAPAKN